MITEAKPTPHPRRTPLLKPTAPIQLTAPLWYAAGVAGILNAFVNYTREPLKLLTPQHVRDCMNCDQAHAREGHVANLDASELDSESAMLLLSALKAAIAPSGLTAEFHGGDGEQSEHITIYADRPTTSQLDMKIPARPEHPRAGSEARALNH